MKYTIASEHRDFFRKNQIIEFEDIVSKDQLHKINAEIADIVSKRQGLAKDKFDKISSGNKFLQGRDLLRESPVLKKAYAQFAEYAAALSEKNGLRFGCDQYLPWIHSSNLPIDRTSYSSLFKQPMTLNDFISLKDIICGFILCLNEAPQEAIEAENPLPFPHKDGSAVFVGPEHLLNFRELSETMGANYLLIVFAESAATYDPKAADPFANQLKHMGYIPGEKLKEKTHPLLCR